MEGVCLYIYHKLGAWEEAHATMGVGEANELLDIINLISFTNVPDQLI